MELPAFGWLSVADVQLVGCLAVWTAECVLHSDCLVRKQISNALAKLTCWLFWGLTLHSAPTHCVASLYVNCQWFSLCRDQEEEVRLSFAAESVDFSCREAGDVHNDLYFVIRGDSPQKLNNFFQTLAKKWWVHYFPSWIVTQCNNFK